MTVGVAVNSDEIAAFCRKHHIRKLSLFGSVLRDDVLAEAEPLYVEA